MQPFTRLTYEQLHLIYATKKRKCDYLLLYKQV